MFSGQDVLEANKMVKEILGLGFGPEESRMYVSYLCLVYVDFFSYVCDGSIWEL